MNNTAPLHCLLDSLDLVIPVSVVLAISLGFNMVAIANYVCKRMRMQKRAQDSTLANIEVVTTQSRNFTGIPRWAAEEYIVQNK